VLGSHKHGHIAFANMGPGNAAVTSPSGFGIGLVSGKVTITINEYTDSALAYLNAGYSSENAETLFHELAHANTFLRGFGGFTRYV
jgi:hypothetical protein